MCNLRIIRRRCGPLHKWMWVVLRERQYIRLLSTRMRATAGRPGKHDGETENTRLFSTHCSALRAPLFFPCDSSVSRLRFPCAPHAVRPFLSSPCMTQSLIQRTDHNQAFVTSTLCCISSRPSSMSATTLRHALRTPRPNTYLNRTTMAGTVTTVST